ncbi:MULTISPECIES: MJ1477/TM1410 family putative glycoside hydrolase [Kordiimonas]|jgi:cysteinyl-tRNA synthetase|uniref:MJ1477/TM1410 family putative glycoside hydrolase n=1 Tax=Kordiimonas TaxID=288021 RepID=UPI00257A8FB2|nr:MJ1477/TM1410 family putative glycoside hydrolase [Kordiimonas sp. UBA4487]
MGENPLSDVDSWLYHLGDTDAARLVEIGDSSADMVVIEFANYADEETPYTEADLEVMRGDDDKLIVSYLSIGEAEDYRFYWDDADFIAIRDSIIDNENPEWVGNFKVRYWMDKWQQVIFDYVERIIDGGFEGVYLDIIDGYEYWEELEPNADVDYRQEMADFVAAIRAHAEAYLADVEPDRTFVVIGQNGEELLENSTYLNAIDGVGKEDLQFYYENTNQSDFSVQDADSVAYSLALLTLAENAGKEVFLVEYLNSTRQDVFSTVLEALAEQMDDLGIPLYVAENRALDDVFPQPDVTQIIESLQGTAAGDILRGGFGRDMIDAHGGNDQIWAGPGDAGDDLFIGGAGADIIGGGTGDDFLVGGGADDGNVLDWLPENGNALDDGADILFGGKGNDILLGGGWDDGLIADNGVYDEGEAIITGLAANQIWAGPGNDLLIGAAGADELGGGTGDDTIHGHDGADMIYSALGVDQLFGGAGADMLFGGAGDYADTLWGEAGDDTLFGGAGGDLLQGGLGGDELFGGAGDDTVNGDDGTDILWAGAGDDLLTGGLSADVFAFAATSGADTVTDFDLSTDTLDLTAITSPFADITALEAAASEVIQSGQEGLLIDLGASGSVFLIGLVLDDLDTITVLL